MGGFLRPRGAEETGGRIAGRGREGDTEESHKIYLYGKRLRSTMVWSLTKSEIQLYMNTMSQMRPCLRQAHGQGAVLFLRQCWDIT